MVASFAFPSSLRYFEQKEKTLNLKKVLFCKDRALLLYKTDIVFGDRKGKKGRKHGD
jgi:hypothetical protein